MKMHLLLFYSGYGVTPVLHHRISFIDEFRIALHLVRVAFPSLALLDNSIEPPQDTI